jgi:hypothetical protein
LLYPAAFGGKLGQKWRNNRLFLRHRFLAWVPKAREGFLFSFIVLVCLWVCTKDEFRGLKRPKVV